jgi:hypothetical protein
MGNPEKIMNTEQTALEKELHDTLSSDRTFSEIAKLILAREKGLRDELKSEKQMLVEKNITANTFMNQVKRLQQEITAIETGIKNEFKHESGAYFSLANENFYCKVCRKDMGKDYYSKHETATPLSEEHASSLLQSGMAHIETKQPAPPTDAVKVPKGYEIESPSGEYVREDWLNLIDGVWAKVQVWDYPINTYQGPRIFARPITNERKEG